MLPIIHQISVIRKFLLFFASLSIATSLFAQDAENLPTDYLPASFHAGRRQALRELMPSILLR
jgi:Xaa-Pro aminopeptidase